ncbi:MAG: carboxypeptidase regulatory-like domain-containing protein [Candidatus Dojkabacteria bacterium]
MEPHPVPQNILDVEFKLFGAFTLKQFGKILVGCLIGVGIFLININVFIKIPLVIISVFTGILLAIIPNFGVWLSGFIKALFISPRYVWMKKTELPEILKPQITLDPEKDRNVSSALNKKKLDINELPLERLFGTQAQQNQPVVQDKLDGPEGDNLNRVYGDIFDIKTKVVKKAPEQAQAAAPIQTKAKMAMAVQPQNTPEPKVAVNPQFTTVEQYQEEINRLKYQLSILAKDANYKEKEEEIMSKINDLYREIKLINGGKVESNPRVGAMPKVQIMQSGTEGKIVHGIVVDKADQPVTNATIKFTNQIIKKIFTTNSGKDGKFSSVNPLPPGDYSIFLEFPGKQFHAYNINVSNKDLPAYKLREK